MLTRLSIANLATIERLTLEPDTGYTVLTGETGAGKSILIDAIRFVLGGRASGEQVRTGAAQTVVEAVFDVSGHAEVTALLEELNVPHEGELTLRRRLQENGRNRATANDCSITQKGLEALGRYLVNIHGQHDSQMLLEAATHVDFLDAFGGLNALRGRVGEAYNAYARLLRRRKELREQAEQRESRRAELSEGAEELRAAALSTDEEAELQAEHTRLAHAEQLGALLEEACQRLYEGEEAALHAVSEAAARVEQAAGVDAALRPQAEALAPLHYQLDDIYQALRSYAAGLEADPARLEVVNERLALLEKLKRRYGGSVEAALEWLANAEQELESLERLDDDAQALEGELREVAERLHGLADELSRGRADTAARLDEAVQAQLHELGMERAVFTTRIDPLQREGQAGSGITPQGRDAVEFLLSTNPGQQPRPLARIASGGELSRTMLALKTVLARADPTRTLIFDEVDAGISGGVAEIVGRKLRGLGATHQVLCVTHLPQIAALSQQHVLVAKETEGEQTYTQASTLDEQARVQEVARLLSGLNVTGHTLASAEEMVNRGRELPVS